jgi:hypothetical protein
MCVMCVEGAIRQHTLRQHCMKSRGGGVWCGEGREHGEGACEGRERARGGT